MVVGDFIYLATPVKIAGRNLHFCVSFYPGGRVFFTEDGAQAMFVLEEEWKMYVAEVNNS